NHNTATAATMHAANEMPVMVMSFLMLDPSSRGDRPVTGRGGARARVGGAGPPEPKDPARERAMAVPPSDDRTRATRPIARRVSATVERRGRAAQGRWTYIAADASRRYPRLSSSCRISAGWGARRPRSRVVARSEARLE